MTLSAGDVPDVTQEELYPPVQGSNLREGFPEMVEQFDGVKLLFATATGGEALLVVLTQMCAQGRAVFSTSGGRVSSVLRAAPVRANPQSVVYKWS